MKLSKTRNKLQKFIHLLIPNGDKNQIASAVKRKRSKKQGVGGKPTNVKTFVKKKK